MKEDIERSAITLDFNCVMADRIGPEHGIAESQMEELSPTIKAYSLETKKERNEGGMEFARLPHAPQQTVKEIVQAAADIRERFDNLVVLGIGGSALGTIALTTALKNPYYNLLPREERQAPRIFVLDNVDPVQFHALLQHLSPHTTVFNVVTKSGSTAETIAQFLAVRDLMKEHLGDEYVRHIVVTTDPEKGPLRKLCSEEKYLSFEVPPGVGGRFSVLSPVGLLPAAIIGIDIEELLEGAAFMARCCETDDLWKNPAYAYTAVNFLAHTKKHKSIVVMMAYAQALRDIADWFRQLWAESLGKKFATDGSVAHTGTTPVKALGTTDQHSQIQLYVEGPNDKLITFLEVKQFPEEVKIPGGLDDVEGMGYLCGHTMNELFAAELQGTRIALTEAQRPNATITLPAVTPHTVGQLLFMLELQTAMAGKLYRIDPFDQPGVEAGKVAAYALLARKGYEKRRKEIEAVPTPDNRYVI